MATAFEVASSIIKWALSHNLVQGLPAGMEGEYVANVDAALFSDAGEDVLRRRGITSVVFNDPDETVYVYTDKRVTQKETDFLPKLLNGCSVEYPQGMTEDLGGPIQSAQGDCFTFIPGVNGNDPIYCCGSSVSPGNEASAGTLGALVRKPGGQLYGLTNNHVSGGCNHSPINLPILAPGVLDVMANTLPPFTIGYHSEVLPFSIGTSGNVNISDNTDAALFRIADGSAVSSMQGSVYDTPVNVADPIEQMIVEKVGRTTGHTTGRIVGRELRPLRVKARSARNGFEGIIMFPGVFVVHGDTRPFSEGGDSGSLVVTTRADGTKLAVGIVFAGGADSLAPGGKRTSILPIAPILRRFNATLVGGHNANQQP